MGVKKVAEDLLEWIKNLFRTGYASASPLNKYEDCIPKDGDLSKYVDNNLIPEEVLEDMQKAVISYKLMGQSEQEATYNAFAPQADAIGLLIKVDNLINDILNKGTEISYIPSTIKQNEEFFNFKEKTTQELTDLSMYLYTHIEGHNLLSGEKKTDDRLIDKIKEKINEAERTLDAVERFMPEYNMANNLIEQLDKVATKSFTNINEKLQEYINATQMKDNGIKGKSLFSEYLKESSDLRIYMDKVKRDMSSFNSEIAKSRVEKMCESIEKELQTSYETIINTFEKENDPNKDLFKTSYGVNKLEINNASKEILKQLSLGNKDYNTVEQGTLFTPEKRLEYAEQLFSDLWLKVKLNQQNPIYQQNEVENNISWLELADLCVKVYERTRSVEHPKYPIPEEIRDGLDKAFGRFDYSTEKNINATNRIDQVNLDVLKENKPLNDFIEMFKSVDYSLYKNKNSYDYNLYKNDYSFSMERISETMNCIFLNIDKNYYKENHLQTSESAIKDFDILRKELVDNKDTSKQNWYDMANYFVELCEKTHPEFQISENIKQGLDEYIKNGNNPLSQDILQDKYPKLNSLLIEIQSYNFETLVKATKAHDGQEINKEPIKENKEPVKEQSYAERHMDSVDMYVDKTAHDYAYQDLGDFGKLRVVRDMQDYMQKANKVKEQLKDVSDKETFVNHPEVRKLWGQFREVRDDVVLQLAIAESSMTFMHDETEKQQMEFAIRKIEDMLVDCMIDGRNTLYKDFIDKGEINEFGLDKQAQFLNQIHKEVENEMDFITRDD